MTNKSITDIFADFRADNLKHQHIYETICGNQPELSKIRNQIKEIGLEKLQCAISGRPAPHLDEQLCTLATKEETLLDDISFPKYNCDICQDTGFFQNSHCRCLLNRIYRNCYHAVEIETSPISFTEFNLDLFDNSNVLPSGKTQREWMDFFVKNAKDYIDTFPNTKRSNILIRGKAGLGKSYLLYCMAKMAYEKNIDVMLIRANELFTLFFNHRMGDDVDLTYLYKAELLMIDDIGTEPITQNVTNEYFYELITKRLANHLHTVFVTNVDDLQTRYDDRISSRLKSKNDSLFFILDGKDLRLIF